MAETQFLALVITFLDIDGIGLDWEDNTTAYCVAPITSWAS